MTSLISQVQNNSLPWESSSNLSLKRDKELFIACHIVKCDNKKSGLLMPANPMVDNQQSLINYTGPGMTKQHEF